MSALLSAFFRDPGQEWRRAAVLLLPLLATSLYAALGPAVTLDFPVFGYLAAHSALETLAVVLALLSFGLLWTAPESARRAGTVVLSATLAASAVLDFLHMLSYAGMPPMVTPSGVEKGIAFWLGGRFTLMLGMLCGAWLPTSRLVGERGRLLVLLAALAWSATCAAVVLGWPERLPRTFVPGVGLTAFKVQAEGVLIAGFLVVALRLQWLTREFGTTTTHLAIGATLMACGEACFASYGSPTDLLNGLGHLFKLSAYGYLARAAYLLAVRQPLAVAGGVADALEATINPALICNEYGIVRWANPAFVRATGYPHDEITGLPIETLQVRDEPSDRLVWEAMRAAMAEGRAWTGRVKVRRRDGSVYLDGRSLTPIRGRSGHLSGFVLLGDDITERERQARALQASEERLRALLDCAPDGVVVIDEHGVIQRVNPATERLFGYRADELLGQPVTTLMPPDMARLHDGHLQRYARTGQAAIIGSGRDLVGRHKAGHALQVHLTIGEARLPDGRVYVGFIHDIRERLRDQAELAEREQRYRALMDTALDGVFILDGDGRFLEVNDAYLARSGFRRDELLRMAVPDVEARFSASEVAGQIRDVLERGHTQFESVHRGKSGQVWPVEITATCWPPGHGQLFVFVRDLSQRRAAERALRESEQRFELALRGANDGLWDYQVGERTLYLSPRCKEMVGYRDDELGADLAALAALVHPDDALAVNLGVAEATSGQGRDRFDMELRLRHRDGRWVQVLTRGQLVRDEQGRPARLVGTLQDLSERRESERALRESEDKLRNLFEMSPLGIALCTLDGRLVEFNDAYRRLTGHDADTLRALSYWDITPPEYVGSEREQLEVVARTGRYGPYDKEYRRADGNRIPVRLNGVRIELDGVPYLWSIVENLTPVRALEAERHALQLQQVQTQKLEALGQLTGGIAHDFNNMLAGIMGLARLGLERHVEDPQGKLARYLREIVRTSERGRDLVAKMLAYVRTEEAGAPAASDLAPMVREMCDLMLSSLPEGVGLVFQGEAELPPVRITEVDMHQIVMNLVLNARDAVLPQGRVEVRLSVQHLDQALCFNCQQRVSGPHVVLEVSDDGPGIPADVLPRIFDPFFTTKPLGKGTGLGLSSVQGLVHKAGGHVQVQARAPHGTVMRVLLPVAEAPLPEPAAPAPSPRLPGPSQRPLLWVVDDDPAVLVFLSELLRESGYEVQAYASPAQALADLRVAPVPPAALVTDQAMPGLSGTQLAEQAMALLPALPVILCTGYSGQLDAEGARALGIRHFLRKPFEAQALLDALADVLPGAEPPPPPLY